MKRGESISLHVICFSANKWLDYMALNRSKRKKLANDKCINTIYIQAFKNKYGQTHKKLQLKIVSKSAFWEQNYGKAYILKSVHLYYMPT